MYALPRWYCPAGTDRPAHLPALIMPQQLVAGAGPDVSDGGKGGGTVYGGGWTKGEPGWIKTAAGFWVNLDGVAPQTLVRAQRHRQVKHWKLIHGVEPETWWAVPQLLSTMDDEETGQVIAYVSDLDQVLGPNGWTDPHDLAELQERLRLVAITVGTTQQGSERDDELVDLVLDLLTLGHQGISRHEVIAKGWLSFGFMLRVLIAAAGIPEAPRERK